MGKSVKVKRRCFLIFLWKMGFHQSWNLREISKFKPKAHKKEKGKRLQTQRNNMIKIGVKIRPKREILDSPGRAILNLLRQENPSYKDCRFGKYIELSIDSVNKKEALKAAKKSADVLYNPLVETLELEVIK